MFVVSLETLIRIGGPLVALLAYATYFHYIVIGMERRLSERIDAIITNCNTQV